MGKIYNIFMTFLIILIVILVIWFFYGIGRNIYYDNVVYTIEVSGTSGVNFSGYISGGLNPTDKIEGIIPAKYEVKGWPAVATLSKKTKENHVLQTEDGILTINILKKDSSKVLATNTTNSNNFQEGLLSISTPLY